MYTAEDEEDATRTDFGEGGWSLNLAMQARDIGCLR